MQWRLVVQCERAAEVAHLASEVPGLVDDSAPDGTSLPPPAQPASQLTSPLECLCQDYSVV